MKKRARKPVSSSKVEKLAQDELKLKIEPRGPDQARIDAVSRALSEHPSVREFLDKARSRMLFLELIEPEVELKFPRPSPPPDQYRATFFDYSNNRTICVEGSLKQPKRVKVSESGFQPLPGKGEFEAAVKILEKDEYLGAGIRERQLQPLCGPDLKPVNW